MHYELYGTSEINAKYKYLREDGVKFLKKLKILILNSLNPQ